MKPLFFVFCSGIAGAFFGLSYKLRERGGYPIETMLFFFALFSALFSLFFIVILHEPLYSSQALLLGIPYGLTMMTSLTLYFTVTERFKLNITWTAIQLSVLIPFTISILFYGEKLRSRALYGIACIFVSLLFFSIGRTKRSASTTVTDRRTTLLLVLASLFTGIAMSFTKIYASASQEKGLFSLFLFRGLSMIPLAFLFSRVRGRPMVQSKPPIGMLLLAAFMSLNALLVGVFIICALQAINGSVAFPLRSVINVLAVFLLSFLLFRERFNPLEGVGSAFALAGIVLVSSSMG